ncbi:hypothetical protein V495_08596 [Pseudogymnoascus sp. VKM F-4514 (FW-929)]|nr:hypothetical protein V495_08596 [Pseudogymnoascus sp. VKM F-4514 (FW-929)]KFY60912.1 hypothetical protein V497_03268 [Pseudogymnoascus sp. VKM F-4516 (FW-969)]
MASSPMISAPLKATNEIDWVPPLKDYIRQQYGDDPERYAEECATLNRLRQDMRGAGKDSAAGRDLLYRYYGQLELLDLRFPVDENHIKISFTWFDAFTHKPTSQFSLAYEKASIIFNISAVLSCHAANQSRSEDTGLKTAYHSFQASAGMFTYINENFLHAPSTDLSRDTVKTLIQIMLAQGQEVFLEKQIADGKKVGLLAKLASQAGYLYSQAVEGVQENVNKAIFEKVWLLVTQIKSHYMSSLAQYYQALADDDANSHGTAIARLQLAENMAKDAQRSSNSFPNNVPANSNLSSETGSSLVEITKRHLTTVQEKLEGLIKDNDYIYHQTVPAEAGLTAILKLPAAKAIPVSELYAGQDIQRITGPDIFAKIIPMSVTESASLYDEEKAKMVRAETERVEIANSEMAASLDYLRLPGALQVIKGGFDREVFSDDEFKGWCDELAGHEPYSGTFDYLTTSRESITGVLEKSTKQLDMEESVCEKMRSKYEGEWTQQPSSRLTSTLRDDIKNYRDALEEAGRSDNILYSKMRQNEVDFDEMRSAGETGEADVLFQRALIKVGGKRNNSGSPASGGLEGNLLDADFADDDLSVMDQVARVEDVLKKLNLIKRERGQVLKDLKEKAHNDDISQVLILNKKAVTSHETQLFKSELEKFRPYQQRLLQANHKQSSLMKELTTNFNSLLQDKRVRSEQSKYEVITRQRSTVLAKYKRVYQEFLELETGLSDAQTWYKEMKDTVNSLEKNVETFVNNRRSEGAQLLHQIEHDRAANAGGQQDRERERLRGLMERMSMDPSTSPSNSNPPSSRGQPSISPSAHYPPTNFASQYQVPSATPPLQSQPSFPKYSSPPPGNYYQQGGQRADPYASQGSRPGSQVQQGGYDPSSFARREYNQQPTSPPPSQQHFSPSQYQYQQHHTAQPVQQQQFVPAGYVPPPPPPGPPPLGPQQSFPQQGQVYQQGNSRDGYSAAHQCFINLDPTFNSADATEDWHPAAVFGRSEALAKWVTVAVLAEARRAPQSSDDPKDISPEEIAARAAKEKAELERKKEREEVAETKTKGADASSTAGASGGGPIDGKGSSATSGGGEQSGNDGGRKSRKSASDKALQKPTVPEIYPQVMAIPIAKRPLFPGFYKAVTIRDPNVAAAIQEMIKRGQPYIGAFLFKDENADKDIIENMGDVHDVGVFAQITSAFPVHGEPDALTAVLYPHRRIRISTLVTPDKPGGDTKVTGEQPPAAEPIIPDVIPAKPEPAAEPSQKKGDAIASFEEVTPESKTADESAVQYEPTAFLRKYPVSLVNVENMVEEAHDAKSPIIRAVTNEIVNVFKEVASLNSLFRDQISTFSMSQSAGNVMQEPAKLADFAAAVSSGEVAELQDVLETLNIEERLQKALVVLKKELMNAQLQSKISKDVENKIQKRQREYWLMEQMKGIRRELGIESDGKDKLVEKFKDKASKLAMPEAVKKVFDEELNKLAHLEPAASEFNVTRNYLDWLTQIPWGQRSAENFGIKNAMTVLDEDHYGLKDVKDRILEFIAVGKLRGTVEGKILCFVGPPGVGKTSIGKSIARALNRQYYRFSVGGLTDVAEIKGHRRTYVGALPGRIIQALKKCQTENPLILIDEIDKIGRGHQGDPASALLELLDPEQNSSFLDHYMDVPVDLSKVLFVCTANMTDTIPRPLLDRMEMIELSGYVSDEKMAIAQRYLGPAAKELAGLKDVDVDLSKEAIEELIKSYCRESGVRNLKKQIEKVYRKSALKIVQDLGETALPEEEALTEEGKAALEASKKDTTDTVETSGNIEKETTEVPRVSLAVPESVHVTINKENLKDYVGAPVFTSDRLYDITPPGVCMGLAWTQMGGAALYVESILESALNSESRPGLATTGNLKAVMKESTTIAYSFAKSVMAKKFPENHFFDKAKLHLHCPEGAVQKDGPSAGITMATSMLSLALDTPLDPTIAMTGELTVTGKVLRIGGLREKTVAARRAGSKKIIFPYDNLSDWLELPENIKEGIEGHPAKWYSDVFGLVFPDLDVERANSIWKKQLTKPKKEDNDEDSADDD